MRSIWLMATNGQGCRRTSICQNHGRIRGFPVDITSSRRTRRRGLRPMPSEPGAAWAKRREFTIFGQSGLWSHKPSVSPRDSCSFGAQALRGNCFACVCARPRSPLAIIAASARLIFCGRSRKRRKFSTATGGRLILRPPLKKKGGSRWRPEVGSLVWPSQLHIPLQKP
jgi:hypothetical protein